MSQCRAYTEKFGIDHNFYTNVSICCGNCLKWNSERCRDEATVVASQDLELIETLKLCEW